MFDEYLTHYCLGVNFFTFHMVKQIQWLDNTLFSALELRKINLKNPGKFKIKCNSKKKMGAIYCALF